MAEQVSPTGRLAASKLLLQNKYIRSALIGLGIILIAAVMGFSYAYAVSPSAIRYPAFEHLHFRMQVVVDGKKVNFADKKFQEGYAKDNCNAALTLRPIHFHDNKDQFVHIHWKHMTGGQVLKYYGWNQIGGVDGMLGTRFDTFPNLETVPIHGVVLPKVKDVTNYYVYTGDAESYKIRSLDSFLQQNLEQFFDKPSAVEKDEAASLLDRLFPKAAAHAGHDHSASTASQEDLARINNLLGNVVIFAQRDRPSDAQIKARFAALEPLSESTCGG